MTFVLPPDVICLVDQFNAGALEPVAGLIDVAAGLIDEYGLEAAPVMMAAVLQRSGADLTHARLLQIAAVALVRAAQGPAGVS